LRNGNAIAALRINLVTDDIMEGRGKRLTNLLIYAVVRLGIAVVQMLTEDVACALAAFLGWLAYAIDRRHRNVAVENLRHAFPGLAPSDRDKIVRATFRHFAALAIELARLRRGITRNTRHHFAPCSGRPDAHVQALTSGRPVIMVTGHFGNWELASYCFGMMGMRWTAIARPLDNPYLEDWLRNLRERTGHKMVAKKGEFDQIVNVLAEGKVLGVVADQDAGPKGLFVDFLGRPASTHKALAIMAIEHRALIVVSGMPRVRWPRYFRGTPAEVIDAADFAHRPDAIRALTERWTKAFEQAVRQHPEQYFWLHRRWKSQPPVRKARKAA
jgi:KDO2-lipid IV(A) lauroyltransferase